MDPNIGRKLDELELFVTFVSMCIENKDLVRSFDRLRGTNISGLGSPLDLMIDGACGRLDHDMQLFFEFILNLWSRVDRRAILDQ